MSRTLSSPATSAIYAPSTKAIFLELITITHPDLSVPIRLVNNLVDVTSRGNVYTAFPFQFRFHADKDGELPTAELSCDNVSQLLIQAVRAVQGPATVNCEVVLASSPDTVEMTTQGYTLQSVNYDARTMTLVLVYEPLTSEPYPAGLVTPLDFPLAFNAVPRT